MSFPHHELGDGDMVMLGNIEIQAISTPGHALAHNAYLVSDHRRSPEPWFVLTGDALLVGDAGRPDLQADDDQELEEMARLLYRSLTERLLALPDHVLVYPAHYTGSVCGCDLSGHPASTIGFERRHNQALRASSEDAFVAALLRDIPPVPSQRAQVVAANRAGRPFAAFDMPANGAGPVPRGATLRAKPAEAGGFPAGGSVGSTDAIRGARGDDASMEIARFAEAGSEVATRGHGR